MAKLPTYEQLGDSRAPQANTGIATYNPTTGAETAPGQAMAQVGQQITANADHIWNLMEQEREKTDTIKVEDAWNQYKSQTMELTHGQNGLLKTEGADAINGSIINKAKMGLEDARAKIMDGLATDEQKARFRQRADITDLQTKQQLYSHLATEQKQYAKVVFTGSTAAARAQIIAAPADQQIFDGAKETLLRQADEYLRINGVTDKNTREELHRGIKDDLWTARIDTLLETNPVLADAMFRANSKEISDPKKRLVLQASTREASLSVNAGLEAARIIDQVRQEQPALPTEPVITPQAPSRGVEVGQAPNAPRSVRNNNPGNIVKSSIKWEGEVEGNDSRFVTFATPEAGMRAMQKNLLAYQRQGLDTVAAIIQKWAPPKSKGGDNSEEATANYVATVAKTLGVAPNAKINLNDPATMQKITTAIAAVESGSNSGGQFQTVGNQPPPEPVYATSGMPQSRDVAAQLPIMMTRVEAAADKLYGKDPLNPDRAAFIRRTEQELQARVSRDVQQLNAVQRAIEGRLTDAILGMTGQPADGMVQVGGGQAINKRVASLSELLQNPQLAQDFRNLDAQKKPVMLELMNKTLQVQGDGNPILARQIYDRINLPAGNPDKILFPTEFLGEKSLSISQIEHLQRTLASWAPPGGRTYNELRTMADTYVANQMKANFLFTAQPDKAMAAANLWSMDAGKKIDEYVAAKKDPRTLFMRGTKDSLIEPEYLQTYATTTPGAGLASKAGAVANGTQQPIAQQAAAAPQQPANITTREQLNAWINTLPPDTRQFRTPDGKALVDIPARAGAAQPPTVSPITPATAASAPVETANPAVATMDATGKIVTPSPAAPPAEPTVEDFAVVTKADTVRGRIAEIAAGRKRAAEIRKGGAQGPQFQLSGPLTSIARGATAVGDVMLAGPAAVGGAIGRAIPTELEAIYAGFDAIKKTRKVSAADQDILEQTLKYGLLSPADEQLAKGLLAKIKAK